MIKDKEFKEMVKGQKCAFEYEGKKCPIKDIVGVARGKFLCKTHFRTVTRDNARRQQRNMDIPTDMVFSKVLMPSETWSFLNKYKGGKNGNTSKYNKRKQRI